MMHIGRPLGRNDCPRPEGTKVCKVCRIEQPFADFYSAGGGSFAHKCKTCWRLKLPTPVPTMAERFWPKVQKTENCWLWLASLTPDGYGEFRIGPRQKGAHRAAWMLAHGPIPTGLFVCHHCDNPKCVRPDHLFLGTCADNMQDAARKGRMRNGDQRGERNANAVLDWPKVEKIRALTREGVTRADIARRIGVAASTVFAVANGLTWNIRLVNPAVEA